MSDKGHSALIIDIEKLLREAEDYSFHDKKSTAPSPKVKLVLRLNAILDNNLAGKYDNS